MTVQKFPKSIILTLSICISVCVLSLPPVAVAEQNDKAAAKPENAKKQVEEKKEEAPSNSKTLTSWQQLYGTDYLGLPDVDREIYVIGLSDAYNWSYVGGFKKMRWIVDCTENKYGTVLTTLFDEWLAENPDRWEEPAAKLFAFAMFQQCDFAGASN